MTTLYDYKGDPIKMPRRPERDRLAQPSRMDRWGRAMTGSITPGVVARTLRAAESGDLSAQAGLFDRMLERDARLRGLLQSRCNAIRGLDWQIEPAEDTAKDREIAAFCTEVLAGCRYFRGGLGRLNHAVGHGFAALELFWGEKDGRHVIEQVQEVPQRRFVQDPESRELRLLTETNSLGDPIPPFRTALHRYDALAANVGASGLFRTLVWLWVFKHYSLKDFAIFCEIYGIPLRLGKYGAGASDEEKRTLRDAVQHLGSDGAGIVSKDTEIEFVEISHSKGSHPHLDMIDLVNTEMAIAVLGQTLTTDAGDRGTQALGSVHDQVRMDLVEGDADELEDTVRHEILAPLVSFNFGPEALVPEAKLPVPRPKDTERTARTIQVAVQSGVKVPMRWAQEQLEIPEPEEGEELVLPMMATPEGPEGEGAPAATRHASRRRTEVRSLVDRGEGLSDDDLAAATGPAVEAAAGALEAYAGRIGAMVASGDWRLPFEDVQALGVLLDDTTERGLMRGADDAVAEMAEGLRAASDDFEETYDFIPAAAAQFHRVKAFSVATVTDVRLLEAMKDGLQRAIEEGRTRADFAREINAEFDRLGVGRLSDWHLRTVFQTNYLSAYSAGRFHAMVDPRQAKCR